MAALAADFGSRVVEDKGARVLAVGAALGLVDAAAAGRALRVVVLWIPHGVSLNFKFNRFSKEVLQISKFFKSSYFNSQNFKQ